MKMRILFFSVLIPIFSCSSLKKIEISCKENPFEELDSLQKANQKLKYTISKPQDWKKGKTSNGDWYFLEDKFIDSLNYYSRKADVYIGLHKTRKECNLQSFSIEDYLHYYINEKRKWYRDKDFKYILLKSRHDKYGRIYILKFNEKMGSNKIFVKSFFLFFQNNKGYAIQYSAQKKYYDSYLPTVEKMINSFRILE